MDNYEEKLAKSLDALKANGSLPIAIFDRHMRCLGASSAWGKIFGTNSSACVGQLLHDIDPLIYADQRLDYLRVLKGQTISRKDDSIRHNDGSVGRIRSWLYPWNDDRGENRGLVFIAENVTEDFVEQEEGLEGQSRWKALMQVASGSSVNDAIQRALELGSKELGLPIGIVSQITGDTYRIRNVYAPGFGLTGHEDFELGHTYCSITLANRAPVAISNMRDSQFFSHPCYGDFKLEAYIGSAIKVNGRLFGTLNFSGPDPMKREFSQLDLQFIGLMSKWIGAQLERVQLEEELQQTINNQKEFFAVVGHDLKNQIGAALELVNLMTEADVGLDEEDRDNLRSIQSHFRSTQSLMLNLLSWGRESLDGSVHRMIELPVNLGDMAKSVFSAFEVEAYQSGVKLTCDGDSQERFFCDTYIVERILHNLIRNALDHTPRGGQVKLSLEIDDLNLSLVVLDTGAGLSDRMLAELNDDTVKRLPAAPSKSYKTGFGLVLSRSYAKRHGGVIRFENNHPRGVRATFKFSRTPGRTLDRSSNSGASGRPV